MLHLRNGMTRFGLLAAVLLGLLTIPTTLRAADAPPKPPELKVLDKLIGEWTTQAIVTVLDGQPQDLKTTGTATREWALDGRIVEESGKASDGGKVRVIFTFDASRRAYRWWFFSSSGINVDMTGQWDQAAQTLTFRTDLGNGLTQSATIHFTDADHHEWASKVTDAAGKVLFDSSGTLQRRK